jgi:hypothetical protein
MLDNNIQLVQKDQVDKIVETHFYKTYSLITWLLFKFKYYDEENDELLFSILYKVIFLYNRLQTYRKSVSTL